ncbi:toprim domain-containing protein [Methylobacterium nigriterrae]|uniref:toprim domain-containing protein n=1 Tax=Methylobacterium nigriterrae TaxID=3127512 RepID=UPI003013D4B8
MSPLPASIVAAEAATRLNLKAGRDGVLRGNCPCCAYGKPTVALSVQTDGIAISCVACGNAAGIAAIAGIPSELLTLPKADPSKVARALQLWDKSVPASGTLAEMYLRGRGITEPVPSSIRFLPGQRNPSDGQLYPAMISLVQRVPGGDDPRAAPLHASGVHLTFLHASDADGRVRKAATETNKISLGQLRHGGVWLAPVQEIGAELAVAEGIETALSVRQLTGLPTVAALSASGVRSFRWPPQVRRLWIAADDDEVGLRAAERLLSRALAAGLHVQIKVPAGGKNDFNDLIQE